MKRKAETQQLMNIGKLSKLAGVGVETIRFYEREGILPKPERKQSGYRQFGQDTVNQILLIKSIQEMGFTLKEAGDFASGKGIPKAIDRIDRKIEDLKKLQRELSSRSKNR